MKFRTDFVTNSSDSSFVAFNIKNAKLYDCLTNLGIKIESKVEGEIDNETRIVLPSGLSGKLYIEEEQELEGVSSSISAWLVDMLLSFTEGGPPSDYEENEYGEYERSDDFYKELKMILGKISREELCQMDGDIESAHIAQEQAFESDISLSEIIDVHEGIREDKIPTESLLYGDDLSEYDFSYGEPGEVITQRWANGRWITIS